MMMWTVGYGESGSDYDYKEVRGDAKGSGNKKTYTRIASRRCITTDQRCEKYISNIQNVRKSQ